MTWAINCDVKEIQLFVAHFKKASPVHEKYQALCSLWQYQSDWLDTISDQTSFFHKIFLPEKSHQNSKLFETKWTSGDSKPLTFFIKEKKLKNIFYPPPKKFKFQKFIQFLQYLNQNVFQEILSNSSSLSQFILASMNYMCICLPVSIHLYLSLAS